MSKSDKIVALQEAALREPWSGSQERRPPIIQLEDRLAVALSINK